MALSGQMANLLRAIARRVFPVLLVGAALPATSRASSVEVIGGDPLDFGSLLLGSAPTGTVTLQKTGNGRVDYTTICSNNGVSAPGGKITGPRGATGLLSITLMNNPNGCATAGFKSYTVDLSPTTPGGDGRIDVFASVYAPAMVTANTGTLLENGSVLSIENAAGAYRSAAFVDSFSLPAGWTLSGLSTGSRIPAGGSATAAQVLFDQTGLLNGLQVGGTLSLWMENNQAFYGAADRDLGSLSWNLAHTVTGNLGDGMASMLAGGQYDGLYGISDHLLGTTASLIDGNAGSDRTISITWRDRIPGEGPGGHDLLSDVASFAGSGSDLFVLELDYDPALLGGGATESNLAASGMLYLGWNDGGGWTNPASVFAGDRPYDPATDFTLGTWGVDTTNNTVWAVLNGGGDFAVVPEPGALILLPAGTLLLLRRRNRGKYLVMARNAPRQV